MGSENPFLATQKPTSRLSSSSSSRMGVLFRSLIDCHFNNLLTSSTHLSNVRATLLGTESNISHRYKIPIDRAMIEGFIGAASPAREQTEIVLLKLPSSDCSSKPYSKRGSENKVGSPKSFIFKRQIPFGLLGLVGGGDRGFGLVEAVQVFSSSVSGIEILRHGDFCSSITDYRAVCVTHILGHLDLRYA